MPAQTTTDSRTTAPAATAVAAPTRPGPWRRLWRHLLSPQRRTWVPTLLCAPLAVAAICVARVAVDMRYETYPALYNQFLVQPLVTKRVTDVDFYFELKALLPANQMPGPFVSLVTVGGVAAAIMFVTGVLGLCIRRRWVLFAIRKGYAAAYALMIFYAWFIFSFTGRIDEHGIDKLPIIGNINAVTLFYLQYDYLWLPVCVTALMAALHVGAWRRAVINVYADEKREDPAIGDLIVENLRTHGKQPAFRKSTWSSVWAHLLVIIIIPLILDQIGCITPYKAPWGGGKPAVMMQVVKKKQPKKKKRKKFILATDAAIYFKVPDLDDSKIMEEVQEETQVRYMADASAAHGKLGHGDASTPGWEDGFRDGIVRLIRLEYNGSEWDDGMDAVTRADMNFLDRFRELSGGMKTASHSESHPIHYLKKYPKGFWPPFVFMTGDNSIDGVSRSDIKILRDYLLGGGMLFADCGGPRWDRAFRGFIQQVFPDNPLIAIADDDPIFQIPFGFQHGAPPLWHHGGNQAMGVKYKGRWCVFYHPGDMNDAWKTGHMGIDKAMADAAYQLGINIVYHAHMNYLQESRKHRK
jgi:hypothetical protein